MLGGQLEAWFHVGKLHIASYAIPVNVRFYIDPSSGLPHIYNHNLRFSTGIREDCDCFANSGRNREARENAGSLGDPVFERG